MSLTTWWRGTGRRRAADRIPVLTTERDLWMLLAYLEARQLADSQRQNAKLTAANELLATQAEGLLIERNNAFEAYDELAARYTELTAIRVPAPADNLPAIQPNTCDTTVRIPVAALWDAHGEHPRKDAA